jgi:hypothetical protein
MSTARESRKSERYFERVLQAVRNMDKLLWCGSPHHMEDLQEYAQQIKADLDLVTEERNREIKKETIRKETRAAPEPIEQLAKYYEKFPTESV